MEIIIQTFLKNTNIKTTKVLILFQDCVDSSFFLSSHHLECSKTTELHLSFKNFNVKKISSFFFVATLCHHNNEIWRNSSRGDKRSIAIISGMSQWCWMNIFTPGCLCWMTWCSNDAPRHVSPISVIYEYYQERGAMARDVCRNLAWGSVFDVLM